MNVLVFVDTGAGELEKILSGVKTMVLKEFEPAQSTQQSVKPGDSLFFLRNNDECIVRVRATVLRTWLAEESAEENLGRHMKELQTRLQLTEDQYNYWSTRKQAFCVEFEAAQKIPEFHIAVDTIADRTRWIVFGENGPVTEEGETNGPWNNITG